MEVASRQRPHTFSYLRLPLRVGGAVLAGVALLPQAECLGTIRPCLDPGRGDDEALRAPGLDIREVTWTPSIPRIATPQAARISMHRPHSLGAIDISELRAEVSVLFCTREDDCLLVNRKEAPLCEIGNVSSSACSRLKPGEEFLAEPSWDMPTHIIRGGYAAEVRIRGASDDEIVCFHLSGFIVAAKIWWNCILDWRDAIVAFGVAASSSRALGRVFPVFSRGMLPQISGFLIIGVVVGPYGTNLVTRYSMFLMAKLINRVSLAFIAGAAGAEIFLPELRELIGPMLIQVAAITVATMLICTGGLLGLANSGLVALPVITNQGSFAAQGAVCLLAGALMTARSPASAIAVISEMRCGHMKVSKVILGITVLGDVVVLVVFALCMNLSRVATQGGTFGPAVLLTVIMEILASCLLGAVVCLFMRVVIPYDNKESKGDHDQHELEAASDEHAEVDKSSTSACPELQVGLRGGLLIAILVCGFVAADKCGDYTNGRVQLEPLLACTVASCLCGHDKGRRHGLEQALGFWTPIVLLPFFTLAGASLQLNGLMQVLPGAAALVALRLVSIAGGSLIAGRITDKVYPEITTTSTAKNCSWLTLLAQAGVTLGLVLEVQDKFESWGNDFATLIIGVVVLNQLIGPVLCRVGLGWIVKAEEEVEGYTEIKSGQLPRERRRGIENELGLLEHESSKKSNVLSEWSDRSAKEDDGLKRTQTAPALGDSESQSPNAPANRPRAFRSTTSKVWSKLES